MSDLRPTLFLAQLPNLVAGNISIVHGIVGSSRTFIGEESAGVDARARGACPHRSRAKRHHPGRRSLQCRTPRHRPELRAGRRPAAAPFRSVWDRGPRGGIALGSLGAFLVLEAREHADERGAEPLARLTHVTSGRNPAGTGRRGGGAGWHVDRDRTARSGRGAAAVMSGASGAEPATTEEKTFLATRGLPVRATGTHIGQGIEAQFLANLAIGCRDAAARERCSRRRERAIPGRRQRAGVAGGGHQRRTLAWRGRGSGRTGREGTGGGGWRRATRMGRPVVVVTGMGIVTSLGTGKDENWTKLTAGEMRHSLASPAFDTTGSADDHRRRRRPRLHAGMESSVLSETIAWLAGEEAVAESGSAAQLVSRPAVSRHAAPRDRMVAPPCAERGRAGGATRSTTAR